MSRTAEPEHGPEALVTREERRRRTVLVGFAALIVLGMSPIFGHHLAVSMDMLLAGRDHLGALCLIALHHLLAPVHYLFHVLVIAGLAYAIWDRARAWLAVRRALAPLASECPRPGDTFWEAAHAASLDPQRIRVVSGLPNPAFTVGWRRPMVYVASELVEWLSPEEISAVLAHERAHLVRRDPLRLSVLRFLGHMLFWLPALQRLASDTADDAEIIADDAAAAGQPLVLASAILALANWHTPPALAGASIGFFRADLLDRRIRRLAGEAPPVASHVTRRSILGAALALGLVWTSGVMMAHPMPGERPGSVAHCIHGDEWALSHLFCLGSPFGVLRLDCPHVGR